MNFNQYYFFKFFFILENIIEVVKVYINKIFYINIKNL